MVFCCSELVNFGGQLQNKIAILTDRDSTLVPLFVFVTKFSSTMAPKSSLKEQLDEMRLKYSDLENLVTEMQSEIRKLKEEQLSYHALRSETETRQAETEKLLEQSRQENEHQKAKLSNMARELDALDQYGRRYQLILAGKAVPDASRGEDVRDITLWLLATFLGIQLQRSDITACHRLEGRTTIFVRFRDLDTRQSVYLNRTKPIRRGMLVFESLTKPRMEVVQTLRRMRGRSCPFKSFYSSNGTVFLRVREGATPVKLDVGTTEEQIWGICRGERNTEPEHAASGPTRGNPTMTDEWRVVTRGRRRVSGHRQGRVPKTTVRRVTPPPATAGRGLTLPPSETCSPVENSRIPPSTDLAQGSDDGPKTKTHSTTGSVTEDETLPDVRTPQSPDSETGLSQSRVVNSPKEFCHVDTIPKSLASTTD